MWWSRKWEALIQKSLVRRKTWCATLTSTRYATSSLGEATNIDEPRWNNNEHVEFPHPIAKLHQPIYVKSNTCRGDSFLLDKLVAPYSIRTHAHNHEQSKNLHTRTRPPLTHSIASFESVFTTWIRITNIWNRNPLITRLCAGIGNVSGLCMAWRRRWRWKLSASFFWDRLRRYAPVTVSLS